MQNHIDISAAPGEPFILVTGVGLWTPAQFEAHFRRLDRDLRAMRARFGLARVLVDLSESVVQTAETAAVMKHWTRRIYRSSDEVAVISSSALLSMQIRHEDCAYRREMFRDWNAAVAWLLSDKRPEPARGAR